MHRTTTTALALTAGLLLAGCSGSSGDAKPAVTPPTTAAVTTAAAPGKAELLAACEAAMEAGRDTGSGAPECADLPLDDYYDALARANQAGRDKLSTASCRAAIKDQYEPGTAQLTGAPTTPPECADLSEDELSQIALDVIAENTGG